MRDSTPRSGSRRPSTVTVPASGTTRPTRQRIRVVLPEPFGPSSPNTSPCRTPSRTPSSARSRPKFLTTPSTSTASAPSPVSLILLLLRLHRPHRTDPVLGQHCHHLLHGHVEPELPFGDGARDQVEHDRPGEGLNRQQRMHWP